MAALLPPDPVLQRRAARRVAGCAHALSARLRGRDEQQAAQAWLPRGEAGRLHGRSNPSDAILRAMTAELAACVQRGGITDINSAGLEAHVTALCGVQAACERIRSTPTPFAYTLLHRTAWLFCLLLPFALVGTTGVMVPVAAAVLAYAFFGLDALGDELEELFALRQNTVPMDALVRIIEIEVLEGLGETDLPSPLRPVRSVLT